MKITKEGATETKFRLEPSSPVVEAFYRIGESDTSDLFSKEPKMFIKSNYSNHQDESVDSIGSLLCFFF